MSASDEIEYLLWRHALPDGEVTTVYAVRHPARSTRARVVHFPRPSTWTCGAAGTASTRPSSAASSCATRTGRSARSGSTGGRSPTSPSPSRTASAARSVVVDGRGRAPRRACGRPGGARRRPAAGRAAARRGRAVVFDAGEDREGFSTGAGQFDSDITDGRYPRAALGLSDDSLVAVACDGRRSNVDGGLSLLELAEVLVELGAERAINLDGGGSTTLVHRGHLLNRPYSSQDQPAPASRPVVSALAFVPRA